MLEYFLYYYIIINILTFIIYGIDKEKAKKGQWRIPESILLLLAVGRIFWNMVWNEKISP